MIILRIRAREVDAVIGAGFDSIRVYRDVTQNGSFTTRVGEFSMVAGQEFYDFADPGGSVSNYYQFTYYRTATASETNHSAAFSPSPVTGPLGLLTVDYVWATTDIPAVSDLPASKVGELIVRTETELVNYANRFGGLNVNASQWAVVMPIVARILLEEIYLRGKASARSRVAGGLASEKIGSYSYTTRANTEDRSYFTDEIKNMLGAFLLGNRLDTTVKTTIVFPEVNPIQTPLTPQEQGIQRVPYQDLLDKDFGQSGTIDLWGLKPLVAANGGPPSWWDV